MVLPTYQSLLSDPSFEVQWCFALFLLRVINFCMAKQLSAIVLGRLSGTAENLMSAKYFVLFVFYRCKSCLCLH